MSSPATSRLAHIPRRCGALRTPIRTIARPSHPACSTPPRHLSTSTSTTTTAPLLPADAWDTHVHVMDERTFPLHPSAPYRPLPATVADLTAFHASLGIAHAVLVAPSVYATDNACLLDALRALPSARGVVAIDPLNVTDAALDEMHALGVRGARLNLASHGGDADPKALTRDVEQLAERLRAHGWVLQLHLHLGQLPLIADTIPRLGVRIVLDHLGVPARDAGPPTSQPGAAELLYLVRDGDMWVKMSGADRFADVPELDAWVREIVGTGMGRERVVWASDWPHTGGKGANPGGDRRRVQEYRKVDDATWVRRAVETWCGGDEGLARRVWVENPRALFGGK